MSESIISPEQFEQLLPLASAWAEEEETRILAAGIELTPSQMSDARAVGVASPGRVRMLPIASIPAPGHPLLRAAGEVTGLISPFTTGLTLRYGIYVRSDFASDRFLIAHELVHTAQYERSGSFSAFLRQYLHECLTVGYTAAPMELEAIAKSEGLRNAPP